jgi:hypothetical protein
MSRPRQILLEQFYLITRRCAQQQHLIRPDDATNNAFIYCLAVAAERFQIDVLLPLAESNHHHTVIFDRYGRCPEFVEYFHKLFARSQNALRGRCENFWAAVSPSIVRLLDRDAVIDKLIYAASNPVKDHLVERAHHWPGVSGYPYLLAGRPMKARRPLHFFRNRGPMPQHATLTLKIPPELGLADEVLEQLRAGVRAVEAAVLAERRRTGTSIVGRRRVLEQSWKSSSTTVEPRRVLRPRFAGSTDRRVAALQEYRLFLFQYRTAREAWLRGLAVTFPAGTYWLRRFANVQTEPLPN